MSTMQGRIDRSTEEITDRFGGVLRCETCGRRDELRARYWRIGWPTCCGYTMRWWTQRQIDAGEMDQADPKTA